MLTIEPKIGDWNHVQAMLPIGRVVLKNGCYDLLHPGHVYGLAAAAELGDVLVVSLDRDEDIERLKGRSPALSWTDRAFMVAALPFVTAVTWHTAYPCTRRMAGDCSLASLIKFLRPAVWAARSKEDILPFAEVDAAHAVGTLIQRLPRHGNWSSSAIFADIQAQNP